MKAARIILDQVRPLTPEWCWRDDWYTGLDSAYGLLMKFATLNSLTAREIAHIFISKTCGRRTTICNYPNVDLRNASVFDLDTMARIFRLNVAQVSKAFLFDIFPNSELRSSDNLRWCLACIKLGFHTPIFQMNLMMHCPIHGMALQTRCCKCKMKIPYRLRPDVTLKPFFCPHCGCDLAPGIHLDQTKIFAPRIQDKKCIEQAIDLFLFEDESLPVKLEFSRKRLQLGHGDLVLTPATHRGYKSRYLGFVAHVLQDLGYPDKKRQTPMEFERVDRVECGAGLTGDEDTQLDRPWRNRTGDDCDDIKICFDSQLQSVHCVYRALRRHLWRHVVREHQHCIFAASRHLWWHMEGETTADFCPVAEAFIRWRMLWEGCGTPRYLYFRQKKEPFGLIGWLSARPPPCPPYWSYATQLWVTNHIFSNACIESFRERLKVAHRNNILGNIVWKKEMSAVNYDCFWAVSGLDCKKWPARVYIRCPMPMPAQISPVQGETKQVHRNAHKAQLALIYR